MLCDMPFRFLPYAVSWLGVKPGMITIVYPGIYFFPVLLPLYYMTQVRVLLHAAAHIHNLDTQMDVFFSMISVSESVSVHLKLTSNNQACVGEQILCLHKGTGMARVEEIKNSISIDPHRPVSCGRK